MHLKFQTDLESAARWSPIPGRAPRPPSSDASAQALRARACQAIETGSFEAAGAIIADLLTIRADRDRYYYGVDPLFERHPDIVQRLCLEARLCLCRRKPAATPELHTL